MQLQTYLNRLSMTSQLLAISCKIMYIIMLMTSSVSARPKRGNTYEVLTFNTGLVDVLDSGDPNVSGTRTTRRDAIVTALKNSAADIVCLQEAFDGSDVETIVNGLSKNYPYSFSQLHKNGVLPQQTNVNLKPACTSNLTDLGICLAAKCSHLTSLTEFTTCAGTLCLDEFISDVFLSGGQNCFSCVASNLPNFAGARASCTSVDGDENNINANTAGVILLSKQPLADTRSVRYYGNNITLIDRAYLQAKVDNQLTVVCTHLSSTFVSFVEPFISAYISSYAEANLVESMTLIQNFQNEPNVVLLGDFNSGKSFVKGLDPTVPEAYDKLVAAFHTCPLRKCSSCGGINGNSFQKSESFNGAIDHVFGGNSVAVYPPKRVLTETINFKGFEINLSDHYGVMTKVAISCNFGKNKKINRY